MNTKLLTIFTRSPLHVGAGSSVGAVDQPVVRERHTRFPVIPGSAIKGVLADLWLKKNEDGTIFFNEKKIIVKQKDGTGVEKTVYESVRVEDGVKLFGKVDAKDAAAGSLLIGEGKLVAFPIRSAKGCWAWLTCPMVLNRLGIEKDGKIDGTFASDALKFDNSVVFEEYPLQVVGAVPQKVIERYRKFSDEPLWSENIEEHLAVVSDEMFQHFAQNACEIANHNRIDDKSGVVAKGALFSQENVPSETMFVSELNTRDAGDFGNLEAKLKDENCLLQIGADMTTGLGWCSVAMKEVK